MISYSLKLWFFGVVEGKALETVAAILICPTSFTFKCHAVKEVSSVNDREVKQSLIEVTESLLLTGTDSRIFI